jgi:hypothetical protein
VFTPEALVESMAGTLLAGGHNNVGVREWNGSTWSLVAGVVGPVLTIAPLANGHVLVGGAFQAAGPFQPTWLGRFDGAYWHPLGPGFDRLVQRLLTLRNGDLIAGGGFQRAGNVAAAGLARWNGTAWSSVPGSNGIDCRSLVEAPNGDLFVSVRPIDSVTYQVRRFDGQVWTPIAANAMDVLVRQDGTVVLGSAGGLVSWNGVTTQPYLPGLTGTPFWIRETASGQLVVYGSIDIGNGLQSQLVAWNGTSWVQLAQEFVVVLAIDGDDVIVGGSFTSIGGVPANGIARWNGAWWQPYGAGLPANTLAIQPLPGGDLLVATGAALQPCLLHRWNGTTWTTILNPNDLILTMAWRGSEVFLGGQFSAVGPFAAMSIATLRTPCAASTTAYGAGCDAGLGNLQLAAESEPWLGEAWTTTTANMPVNSIGVTVHGLAATSLPLAAALPIAPPGCSLLVAPDLLTLLLPVPSPARASLVLPVSPALVGAVLRQQSVVLTLANGAPVAAASSNALQATLGAF